MLTFKTEFVREADGSLEGESLLGFLRVLNLKLN